MDESGLNGMRLTDLVVRQETRLTPLGVSADRIGHVAMRCACLLAQFAQQGHGVDRGGRQSYLSCPRSAISRDGALASALHRCGGPRLAPLPLIHCWWDAVAA
jgi:hypothetical protein